MKNSGHYIWIVLAVLIVLFLAIFKFGSSSKKRYNWSPRLQHEGKEPYDLTAFGNTLMYKYEGFEASPKNSFSKLIARENVDYFAVGSRLYFKNAELDTLHNFIVGGGRAFLAFNAISDTGLLKLGVPKEYLRTEQNKEKVIDLSFKHPELKKYNPIQLSFHQSLKKKAERYWMFFENSNDIGIESIKNIGTEAYSYEEEYESQAIDPFGEEVDSFDSSTEELMDGVQVYIDDAYWYGNNSLKDVTVASSVHDIVINKNNMVCIKKFKVGEGELFVMLNPILLGNFYTATDSTQALLAGILAHFDAENAILDIEASRFKLGSLSVGRASKPLSYMLSKRWFKIGIYMLLGLSVLFMMMQSFRKYRPVKIFAQPKNRSIEQIKDIATVISSEKKIATARNYYCLSFENWHQSQHLHYQYGKKVEDEALKRCQILASKSVWDIKDLKEFAQLFNQLIIKYGK
jgi:hypothetical protein